MKLIINCLKSNKLKLNLSSKNLTLNKLFIRSVGLSKNKTFELKQLVSPRLNEQRNQGQLKNRTAYFCQGHCLNKLAVSLNVLEQHYFFLEIDQF